MDNTIPEAKALEPKPEDNLWTRRKFLGLVGWGAFLSAIGLGLLGFLRFLFPRALFEPSPVFNAGRIADYKPGEVSEKYIESERVWIERQTDRIVAILAICTHLGCTPRWLPFENKFKCPCHGSGFTKEGINFEGPAPRPLERLAIHLDAEGVLVVDKSKKFRQERGEWNNPDSFVAL